MLRQLSRRRILRFSFCVCFRSRVVVVNALVIVAGVVLCVVVLSVVVLCVLLLCF